MLDEMQTQIARIQKILRALSIPIIKVEGYEADDVLAALMVGTRPPDGSSHLSPTGQSQEAAWSLALPIP